jgi:hypothetical protein
LSRLCVNLYFEELGPELASYEETVSGSVIRDAIHYANVVIVDDPSQINPTSDLACLVIDPSNHPCLPYVREDFAPDELQLVEIRDSDGTSVNGQGARFL